MAILVRSPSCQWSLAVWFTLKAAFRLTDLKSGTESHLQGSSGSALKRRFSPIFELPHGPRSHSQECCGSQTSICSLQTACLHSFGIFVVLASSGQVPRKILMEHAWLVIQALSKCPVKLVLCVPLCKQHGRHQIWADCSLHGRLLQPNQNLTSFCLNEAIYSNLLPPSYLPQALNISIHYYLCPHPNDIQLSLD